MHGVLFVDLGTVSFFYPPLKVNPLFFKKNGLVAACRLTPSLTKPYMCSFSLERVVL